MVDNDGGGIFSFLPQASPKAVAPEDFELLFGTPQGVDLAALARVHGVPVVEVEKAADVVPARARPRSRAGGVRVVLVRTDRATNVARHRDAWSAVAAAIS